MITGPRISVDFVTRLAQSTPMIAPVSGDLMVFLSFTGINDSGATEIPMTPTLTALSLALKEDDGGEILAQSDGWQFISGSSPYQWVLHVPMTGPVLAAALSDSGTMNLLGEICWTMANPFVANIGGASIVTRSRDFTVEYSRSY